MAVGEGEFLKILIDKIGTFPQSLALVRLTVSENFKGTLQTTNRRAPTLR